jgi:hypothetical protein
VELAVVIVLTLPPCLLALLELHDRWRVRLRPRKEDPPCLTHASSRSLTRLLRMLSGLHQPRVIRPPSCRRLLLQLLRGAQLFPPREDGRRCLDAEEMSASSLSGAALNYGCDDRRPSQTALASDAPGRRSGRRPCVCLVLSSSAGARCAVVSSNATLFPPLEHSAGRTWHRREHELCVAFRLICDNQSRRHSSGEDERASTGPVHGSPSP